MQDAPLDGAALFSQLSDLSAQVDVLFAPTHQ
jgi:hypothetical protein